VEQQTLILTQD